MKRDSLYWVERAERGIYWAVGVALILAAATFLAYAIGEAGASYIGGRFAATTIELFDRSLLTLQSMLELGLLSITVLVLALAIFFVRRAQKS